VLCLQEVVYYEQEKKKKWKEEVVPIQQSPIHPELPVNRGLKD